MKIDMHVHSKYSTRSSIWLLNKIGCAESFTEPLDLYNLAKERGMDAVTITDHNSIEGCLEIANLPDTFISCEVTAYFPEDQCKLHVLVYAISEAQYREIDRLRENVYDLVAFCRRENICHVLAHPFYAVNDCLTTDHFERCLLLFKHLELNGDEDPNTSQMLRAIVQNLTAKDIRNLAEKHDLFPDHDDRPWVKYLTCGSDDHSSLNVARHYTEVKDAATLAGFWQGFREGRTIPCTVAESSPETMAHAIYGVAYQFYDKQFNLSRAKDYHDIVRFLDRMLQRSRPKNSTLLHRLFYKWKHGNGPQPSEKDTGVIDMLHQEAYRIVTQDKGLSDVMMREPLSFHEKERYWFRFVNKISNNLLKQLGASALDRLQHYRLFELFETASSALSLYALMAPCFISHAVYSKTRRFSEKVAEEFSIPEALFQQPRVGLFTDTLNDINGVALTLRNQAVMAYETGKDFTVISCAESMTDVHRKGNVKYFQPISSMEMPEYPGQKNYIPPLLEMLQYCYQKNLTHIHGATPGLIGLSALLIARIMKLPFYSTYHTAFPQYVGCLTGDKMIEDLAWKYMIWFYNQCDTIFASSCATFSELVERGIKPEKIRMMPRGVDTDKFNPDNQYRGSELPGQIRLLYTGRISKEKNLPVLEAAFKRIHKEMPHVGLVIAGDGPYFKEMKRHLADTPTHFTGYLQGREIAEIYPACDLFVFPSTTDTFGNVVLEAQASGLPVVVTDVGGPQENLIPNETGIIVKGDDVEALYLGIKRMISRPVMMRQMGRAARQYAESRSLKKSFDQYWTCYYRTDVPVADNDFFDSIPFSITPRRTTSKSV